MTQPETRYAAAGDVDIAYATVGDGPDLVWAFGMMTHLELKWEEPSLAAMLRRLAEFSRLILFDRRGCGLSDRGDRHLAPTLEERVADIVAVLDAAGSRRASLFGVSEGCALAALFASMHPQRTERIILYGGISRLVKDAAHPWGLVEPPELAAAWEPVIRDWGTVTGAAAMVGLMAPSMAGDRDYLAWFARQQRHALSRDAVMKFMMTVAEYDMDEIFPAVRVPTLVLHRAHDVAFPFSSARRIASRIPGAALVELPGSDHLPYVGDAGAVVEAIRQFLAGQARPALGDRQLVTLLATDTSDAESEALVRRHVRRLDGAEIPSHAGGVLARFGTATTAIRCALGIIDAARRQGTGLRIGVHTGECEVTRDGVSGPASRVPRALAELAEPGQVVVSGTVRDLVPGSGIRFAGERRVRLRGLPGEYSVLTAVHPSDAPAGLRPAPSPRSGPDNVFRPDGEYWTVAFEGRVVTLRDSKGMHDLRALLADPARERHVLDLWSDPTGPGTGPAQAAAEELRHQAAPQPVIDEAAKNHYRRRLTELDQQIAEATGRGDPIAAAQARHERDQLIGQLTAAYGLGGRARRIPDEAERARKAVRRRISDALKRIDNASPTLGRHLRHSIHTGIYCSYTPEHDIRWDTGQPHPQAPARR
jgi:pimeloyl-ACP methyl ester carboxylesterase/class 3 adenylate cyclase